MHPGDTLQYLSFLLLLMVSVRLTVYRPIRGYKDKLMATNKQGSLPLVPNFHLRKLAHLKRDNVKSSILAG